MPRLPKLVYEWIKQGLDYVVRDEAFPNWTTAIVIPAGAGPQQPGESEPILSIPAQEGILTKVFVIADSNQIGIRIRTGNPELEASRYIVDAWNIGLFTPHDLFWTPRYNVALGALTVFSLVDVEYWHWYRDFQLTLINQDTNPHNVYFYQYVIYQPKYIQIRPYISLVEKEIQLAHDGVKE
jgi:hypothetical protein